MAPLTLSGFAAIRSRRDPIVRIAHLVREIKFLRSPDRAAQRDVGVAARPYRARVDWVTATCPSPVCGCSRPGRVRRGCELDVQGCAIAWRPTCGASLHPCWKMPVGDLRRPGERASDGTKDLEANSAGPLAIGGRTSLSVGGNQRLTQWRLACASATSHILRYRLGYERALS
jgi:hypothetical protein